MWHRTCLSAAVRAGYGQRRPPSRASSGRGGSSRTIAAPFFEGWTGLGRRAPGGGCPAGRDAGAPAANSARLGERGALACVARDGQGGRAPRRPAVFLQGGRAGLSLVAVCGPRSRSARGRRARHAECRSSSAKGRRWVAFRVPGTATFRSRPAYGRPIIRADYRKSRALALGHAAHCGGAPWLADERSRAPQRHHGRRAGRAPARRPDGGAHLILKCAALDVMPLRPPGPRAWACSSWLLRGPPAGRPGCGRGRHAACRATAHASCRPWRRLSDGMDRPLPVGAQSSCWRSTAQRVERWGGSRVEVSAMALRA